MTNEEAIKQLKGYDGIVIYPSEDRDKALAVAIDALARYEKLLNVVDEYNLMSDWMCEELAEMSCSPSGECWCDACQWSSPTRECIERWLDCK